MLERRAGEATFRERTRRLVFDMLRRARRLRLQQTAASLAFLSLFAAVPVLSIALSVLSALPVFERLQESVQDFLLRNLFPEAFSETVMGYLEEFAGRASRLSVVGGILFFMTAVTALRVIETTMNAIWSTARRRSLPHRIGLYWALLTLAPIALAAVLALNSRVIAELMSGVEMVWVQSIWFAALPWLLGAVGLWLMFLLLPAVRVVPLHALVGALLSGVLLVLLQRGLGWSVRQLPTYEVVYGAFAALPLLLIWLFLAWAAVLAGALLAASLRHWSAPLDEPTPDDSPGTRFDDGVTVLRALLQAFAGQQAAGNPRVIAVAAYSLAEHFGHNAQRAEQAAEMLERLGYVIRLVHLAGRPSTPGLPHLEGHGRRVGVSDVWSERWAWAGSPEALTLRPLFDDLWWAGQPGGAAVWQGDRLDLPLDQALAG